MLRAPFSSARRAPRPDGPLTHFASPRGEKGRPSDGLRFLMERGPLHAYRFDGKHYDAGGKLGFLMATVELALGRDDLDGAFRTYLKGLKL